MDHLDVVRKVRNGWDFGCRWRENLSTFLEAKSAMIIIIIIIIIITGIIIIIIRRRRRIIRIIIIPHGFIPKTRSHSRLLVGLVSHHAASQVPKF